jgi:hypothetical protein
MMPREQFGRRTLAGPSVTRKTHGSAYFGAIKTRREVAGIVSAARTPYCLAAEGIAVIR